MSAPARAAPFVPLGELLRAGRDPAHVVAFGRDGVRTFADFSGRVAALAEELRRRRGARFLVYAEDAYAFAVGLFAAAHAGSSALLAPNRQPGTIAKSLASSRR